MIDRMPLWAFLSTDFDSVWLYGDWDTDDDDEDDDILASFFFDDDEDEEPEMEEDFSKYDDPTWFSNMVY